MQPAEGVRVLVTWGSKHGGTEGIGRIIAQALETRGIEVVAASAEKVAGLDGFNAVIVGGALYANSWPSNVRRFVNRHVARLRKVPVWFFSSGPLDDSADHRDIPPPTQVAVLAERVGANGHVTFGGRLERNVKGFSASAMAKTMAGDWRNPERIRAWGADLAAALGAAKPGKAINHPAHAVPRLVAHAVVGWALCAATMGGLIRVVSLGAALGIHAVAAPLFFIVIAWRYFRARGARAALPTAIAFTTTVAVLDAGVVAALVLRSFAMFSSFTGTWLPFALIFLATWSTGLLMSTLPWPNTKDAAATTRGAPHPGDHGSRVSSTGA